MAGGVWARKAAAAVVVRAVVRKDRRFILGLIEPIAVFGFLGMGSESYRYWRGRSGRGCGGGAISGVMKPGLVFFESMLKKEKTFSM
jgi:hypothetical protein